MKLVQFFDSDTARQHVGLVQDSEVVDLTNDGKSLSLHDVYYRLGGDADGIEATVERLAQGGCRRLDMQTLLAGQDKARLVKPVSGPEADPYALRVWLAGVTHEDSARLREIEAKQVTGDSVNVYEQKYRECAEGGRPELFAKNDPLAVVGPGEPITRPADTERMVPETELVTVYGLNRFGQVELLGFTGGNDVTDNGIEAANPLNLPQAKNWAGGCASLGGFMVTPTEFDDNEVTVSCEIFRSGQSIVSKEGKTGQNHLNMPDGRFHLEHMLFNRIPLEPGQLQLLYWGTPIVFSDADLPAGLLGGDVVRMAFSGGIGVLENEVVALQEIDQLTDLLSAHQQ